MSTPADHGYVKCARCKAWRKQEHVELQDGWANVDERGEWLEHPVPQRRLVCADVAWCSSQVPGVGLGRMDADTGRPAPRLPFSPDSEGTS